VIPRERFKWASANYSKETIILHWWQVSIMKSSYIQALGVLLVAVSGLPAPKLEGAALERLNAPEAWEKRNEPHEARQYMIDGYEVDATEKVTPS
jgi:hypothetical protein